MRTPSPPYCRLDLAPPLADRFIVGVAPIDYGPVLLLMPFGFHLAMDTLPSGNCKRWLQVRLGCVQLSPSCPFRLLHTCLSPGPRGITPAFGYGAPHPSARGTSTLLINALLSAPYDPLRLPVRPSPYKMMLEVRPPPAPDLPQLPSSSSLHAVPSTPVDRTGACRFLPHSRGLPRLTGGSASTTSLSRPAQASLALRPERSQPAQRRTPVPRLRPAQSPDRIAR